MSCISAGGSTSVTGSAVGLFGSQGGTINGQGNFSFSGNTVQASPALGNTGNNNGWCSN